jgi:hypothetical protein
MTKVFWSVLSKVRNWQPFEQALPWRKTKSDSNKGSQKGASFEHSSVLSGSLRNLGVPLRSKASAGISENIYQPSSANFAIVCPPLMAFQRFPINSVQSR